MTAAFVDRSGNDRVPENRTVRRRRPATNGRSLAGGLLVATAAVLVFTAWLGTAGRHGKTWVIARRSMAAGTTLAPGDLTTATMSLAPPTRVGAFSDTNALDGRVLAAPLTAGELVQASSLVPQSAQPALRPVAIAIDPAEASLLVPDNLVDVLVTDGSGPSSPTVVVARGARVISVGRQSSSLAATASGTVVTLGVSSLAEVTAIVHAERTGTLSVVIGETSDGTGLGPAPASTNGSGSTNSAGTTNGAGSTSSTGAGTTNSSGSTSSTGSTSAGSTSSTGSTNGAGSTSSTGAGSSSTG